MEAIKQTTLVKQMSNRSIERMSGNTIRNNTMEYYFLKLLANGIVKSRMSQAEINQLRNRMKRLQGCNKFWLTETYEKSHIKVLLHTYLCKDKFCNNCSQMKKIILQNRLLPHLQQYQDNLYHIVLTVPDCNGENLRNTIWKMNTCFKTLVTYLNGNKKVKGLDLSSYGFQGCIRSLEITYKEDSYHPHFHVAAVLGNNVAAEEKYIVNEFSSRGKRHFSNFEALLQRLWWLLINQKRLTFDNINNEDSSLGRYSCTVDKFQSDDYRNLFGYMTKMYGEDNSEMTYDNFKALYYATYRVRQIQGYGVFYNVKEANSEHYTEADYDVLEDYLLCKEKPISAYEPLSHFSVANGYKLVKHPLKNRV